LQAFVNALREVAPRTKRTQPLQVWRGVDGTGSIYGPSWTTDRDIACWFAMRRSPATPLVFTALLDPGAIVVEHDDRDEREIIADPTWIVAVIDAPEQVAAEEADEYTVPPAVLAEWQAAADRYERRKRASS
jgi:hypothetical protein